VLAINFPSFSASWIYGLTCSSVSPDIDGKLTAFLNGSSLRYLYTSSATSIATFNWASIVDAPKCGVATTFGWLTNGLSALGGSSS